MERHLSIEERIIEAIRRIIRANELHSRRLAARYRITGPQLMALLEIARVERATPSDLARAIHVSQSTMTGILARLGHRRLVWRTHASPDRRVITVALTPAGRRLLAASPPLLQAGFHRALAGLEEWERTALLASLQRVSAMMGMEETPARVARRKASRDATVWSTEQRKT